MSLEEVTKSVKRTEEMLERYHDGDKSCGMNLISKESTYAIPCAAPDCSMRPEEIVNTSRSHFTDSLTTNTYCEPCGCRLRYHRKMWILRGELCPITIDEVNKRHGHKR